jgi:hypothetical protein
MRERLLRSKTFPGKRAQLLCLRRPGKRYSWATISNPRVVAQSYNIIQEIRLTTGKKDASLASKQLANSVLDLALLHAKREIDNRLEKIADVQRVQMERQKHFELVTAKP